MNSVDDSRLNFIHQMARKTPRLFSRDPRRRGTGKNIKKSSLTNTADNFQSHEDIPQTDVPGGVLVDVESVDEFIDFDELVDVSLGETSEDEHDLGYMSSDTGEFTSDSEIHEFPLASGTTWFKFYPGYKACGSSFVQFQHELIFVSKTMENDTFTEDHNLGRLVDSMAAEIIRAKGAPLEKIAKMEEAAECARIVVEDIREVADVFIASNGMSVKKVVTKRAVTTAVDVFGSAIQLPSIDGEYCHLAMGLH